MLPVARVECDVRYLDENLVGFWLGDWAVGVYFALVLAISARAGREEGRELTNCSITKARISVGWLDMVAER